jgi:glycosyltransferase involved in cell wall biosynthesis
MTQLPLVSVVVPCLNRAHFLKPTLDSILQQDYPEIDCIVVDGGSTDGTVDILKGYGARIKWVSEPDDGHGDAINKGWRLGAGQILAWLNADDVWEVPRAVTQAVAFLAEHPDVDVVYGDCGAIDASGKVVGMSYCREWDLAYAVEYNDHCIPQPAAFIRRRILDRVGFLDPNFYAMDKELWFRIGLQGKIRHIPVKLAYARNTPGKINDGRMMARDCVKVARKFYSMPSIPLALQGKKRRTLSNAYLRGMDYAFFYGPHWDILFAYSAKAFLTDPSNFANISWRLGRFLASVLPEQSRMRRVLWDQPWLYWLRNLNCKLKKYR